MTARAPAEKLGILSPSEIPDFAPRLSPDPPPILVRAKISPQQPPATAHASATAAQTIRNHEQFVHSAVIKKLTTSFNLVSAKQFEQSFDLCEQAFIISTRILQDPRKSLEVTRLITHLSGLLCRENQIAMADKVARLAINLSNERSEIECQLLSRVVLNISRCYRDQNHIFSAMSLLKRGIRVVENNTRASRDMSSLLMELSNCYLMLSVKTNRHRQSILRGHSRELFDKTIYLNVVASGEWSPYLGILIFRRWVTLHKCELKEEAQHLIGLKHYVQSRKFR